MSYIFLSYDHKDRLELMKYNDGSKNNIISNIVQGKNITLADFEYYDYEEYHDYVRVKGKINYCGDFVHVFFTKIQFYQFAVKVNIDQEIEDNEYLKNGFYNL